MKDRTIAGAGGRLPLAADPLAIEIVDGDPRNVRFAGTEIVRRISYPVRDPDWGTFVVETVSEAHHAGDGGLRYERHFREAGGAFTGTFTLRARASEEGADLVATVSFLPAADTEVNRAGFTILHPIEGVAGGAMTVRHADGTTEAQHFPDLIRADAPALEMTGLAHSAGPVDLDFSFSGEVFEMEDQRNWSDASFKTFCRPLARPKPFRIAAGEALSQEIRLTITRRADAAPTTEPRHAPAKARMPALAWAADLRDGPEGQRVLPDLAVLLRVPADAAEADLRAHAGCPDLTLEIVLPEGDDGTGSLARLAATCARAGLSPTRVVALPHAYLKCHPAKPGWPARPTLEDVLAPLRAAFPRAAVGGGSLTFFPEFNRLRPAPALVDFMTFGNSAIVHAADDASVIETLEALAHVFASGRALAEDRPLRLGLLSIGMRSNPYGADVAPNPGRQRLPMAQDDPRQHGLFAAAYGVGILAAAAEGGVESLALAMPDGPLGVRDGHGLAPLLHVIRAASRMAGAEVEVEQSADGLVTFRGPAGGLAANLGDGVATLALLPGEAARVLTEDALAEARRDPGWADKAPSLAGDVALKPLDVAFIAWP